MLISHSIKSISFENDVLILQTDEKFFKIALEKLSVKLKNADDFQRSFYKISPSGYGIHWPLIDEDISVEAIIKSQN
ncbi:MAG: DUF2442 domain-containing protein [Bacteroidota bacterium]